MPRDGAELYERLAAGPVVVLATVQEVEIKARLAVGETLRGDNVPAAVRLAYRGANLERRPGSPAFEMVDHETAIFVLEPWVDSRGEQPAPDLFQQAAGHGSRISLPPEGGEALLAAARTIVAYQDGTMAPGESPADWLASPNPWLQDAALNLGAQFAMATPDWIPGLLEQSQSASAVRRRHAAKALAQAIERGRLPLAANAAETDLQRTTREIVVQLARTDPDETVRRAAVLALLQLQKTYKDAEEILRAIARDDPSQEVRYEAAAGLLRGR
ncbi:MAG: HEAT repeat domain-containing protein [Acidobacteria bacterium]|nr:HEAT repeat domain-containing protein [Acidobacteriota bacterium]